MPKGYGLSEAAIATLVERSTRYCQLVALPEGPSAEAVADALPGVTQERLDEVAEKLNRRPRQTLGFQTPAEKLAELIDGLEAVAER